MSCGIFLKGRVFRYPLDLGNVLFCGGGVDVEVRYERPNILKLIVH